MSDAVIIFDEISLVLSKSDFIRITKYNKEVGDFTYMFYEEDSCFVCLDQWSPFLAVFFTPVNLEGRECFEISRIRHSLDVTPNLDTDYEEFNLETSNIIYQVFHLLNNVIFSTDKPEEEIGYRYYIRNKKNGTYDIRIHFSRVHIAEFIQYLSWGFGLVD